MAKAKAQQELPVVEEIHFRSDNAFLCLVLNRRARLIRVIDFRAGALPAKRLFIQSIAKREGVEKVITLVEKDEVSSWTRVGFVREGTIPGFYKRSDGHLCGCVIGEKTSSVSVNEDIAKVADKTVNSSKKAAKDIPETFRGATVKEVEEDQAAKARDQAWKQGVGLGNFDSFGRDAERIYFELGYKKAKANYISAEFQDCFGHSLVEVLRSPKDENELMAAVAGLRSVSDMLKERGIVSAFGFAPVDDTDLGTAYLSAGFRKTGLLASGIQVGNARRDAVLWTRKLANPGEEEV